ncbi:MAG: hypothetical protein ACK5MT_19890 [Actinomycetales bacterium]
MKRIEIGSICAGLLLIAGCGQATPAASSTTPASAAQTSITDASLPSVELEPGVRGVFDAGSEEINTITVLAPDGSGGVWTWLASASSARLLHVKGDGSSSQVPLEGEDARVPTEAPGLAACQDTVWFGVNRSLRRIGADGHTTVIDLPATTAIPAVDAYRPEQLRGLSAVNGVACTGGTAVVTLSNAGQAFLVSPTGAAITIDLPEGYEAIRPAADASGNIAIGLQDAASGSGPHQVMIHSASGVTTQVTVDDSSQLLSDGEVFAAGATKFTASHSLTPYPAAPPDAEPGAALLSNGRRAFSSQAGVLVVDQSGNVTTRRLGSLSTCDQTHQLPGVTATTTATPTDCPLHARRLVASGDTLYLVSGAASGPTLLATDV